MRIWSGRVEVWGGKGGKVSVNLCASLLLFQALAGAVPSEVRPDPLEILRRGLASPEVSYAAELAVTTYAPREETKRIRVWFAPPLRFRREVLDSSRQIRQIILSDGQVEWFYEPLRRKAWKRELIRGSSMGRKLRKDPGGIRQELRWIAKSYRLSLLGTEGVGGQEAWVLEIRNPTEGRVVRKLWIGREHGLILQSKTYGPEGSLSSWTRLDRVEVPLANSEEIGWTPPAGTAILAMQLRPEGLELEGLRAKTGMAPELPAWIPPGYLFQGAGVVAHRGGPVLHYRYSDGMEALSLFQMPVRVRFGHVGRPVGQPRLGRARARLYLDGDRKVLEWRRDQTRFVLISPLPLQPLRQMAESIP